LSRVTLDHLWLVFVLVSLSDSVALGAFPFFFLPLYSNLRENSTRRIPSFPFQDSPTPAFFPSFSLATRRWWPDPGNDPLLVIEVLEFSSPEDFPFGSVFVLFLLGLFSPVVCCQYSLVAGGPSVQTAGAPFSLSPLSFHRTAAARPLQCRSGIIFLVSSRWPSTFFATQKGRGVPPFF